MKHVKLSYWCTAEADELCRLSVLISVSINRCNWFTTIRNRLQKFLQGTCLKVSPFFLKWCEDLINIERLVRTITKIFAHYPTQDFEIIQIRRLRRPLHQMSRPAPDIQMICDCFRGVLQVVVRLKCIAPKLFITISLY